MANPADSLSWVLFVAAPALMVFFVLARVRSSQAQADSEPAPQTRYEDVSGRHLAPPRRLARKIAQLEALGYYRMGEMQMHHPFRRYERPPLGLPRSSIVWVLRSPDGTIMATVVGMGPLTTVELTSVFEPEGRVVVAWLQPLVFRGLMVALLRSSRLPRFGTALPFWGGVARADRMHRELVEHVAQHARLRLWRDVRSFAEWSTTRSPFWESRFVGGLQSHD